MIYLRHAKKDLTLPALSAQRSRVFVSLQGDLMVTKQQERVLTSAEDRNRNTKLGSIVRAPLGGQDIPPVITSQCERMSSKCEKTKA